MENEKEFNIIIEFNSLNYFFENKPKLTKKTVKEDLLDRWGDGAFDPWEGVAFGAGINAAPFSPFLFPGP